MLDETSGCNKNARKKNKQATRSVVAAIPCVQSLVTYGCYYEYLDVIYSGACANTSRLNYSASLVLQLTPHVG